jgi:hypothetical protein
MGIVNAGMLGVYDDLDPVLRDKVEDVVLNRRPDAGEALVEFAQTVAKARPGTAAPTSPGANCRSNSVSRMPWSRESPTSSSPTPRNAAPRWKPPASRRCR